MESEHSKSSQQIQQEWDTRVVRSQEQSRYKYTIQVSGIHVNLTNFEVFNSSNECKLRDGICKTVSAYHPHSTGSQSRFIAIRPENPGNEA
jgi:hypothetical protein